MSKFYISVDNVGDRFFIREIENGIEKKKEFVYEPFLYLKCKSEDKEVDSLYGDPAKKIDFDSISSARDFLSRYKDTEGIEIYGQQNWVLQYLYTYQLKNVDFSLVNIRSIDIETRVPDTGFPNPLKAEAEIVLITCIDKGKNPITFGTKPYNGTDTDYRSFPNETEMLRGFVDWWASDYPMIVTGWNILGFDLPYIVNRISNVLGARYRDRLSPWGKVTIKENRIDDTKQDINVLGVNFLDYIDLMKKYTYGDRASWKLASVAQEELGTTKLDHSEYKTFNDFMDQNWDKFVRYNIIDAALVNQLDDKMQLISLAMTIAYEAKISFSDVYSPVKTWDAILHNRLMDKNIVIPQRKSSGLDSRTIEGGFVKDLIPGMYYDVVSLDATSLYPSIMMTLNLSPETYVGKEYSNSEVILSGNAPKVYDNCAMSANGVMFRKDKLGIIPEIIQEFMSTRKSSKKEMLTKQQEYETTKNEKLKPIIAALDNRQMAVKILMNSLFGAIANSGFRFFNNDIAEAITMTGQLYLKNIDKTLPKKISDKFKTEPYDYVTYIDTDSVYVTLEKILTKFVPKDIPMDKRIKLMEKIAQEHIQVMVNDSCNDISKILNIYDNKISFKLEIASDKTIFCSKKKYAARVYSSEGVTYTKPKIKVMGLEMVRSSTPAWVKDKLENSFDIMFDKNESSVQEYIKNLKEEYFKLTPSDIGRISGVSNVSEKVDKDTIYVKGAPMHVRASLLYNHMIEKMNLKKQYPLIGDGDKIKYLYLKMPNTLRENVIAWPVDEDLPVEFGLHKYIDYDLQFEKTYLAAVTIILDALKWSPEKIDTLDDFFG